MMCFNELLRILSIEIEGYKIDFEDQSLNTTVLLVNYNHEHCNNQSDA